MTTTPVVRALGDLAHDGAHTTQPAHTGARAATTACACAPPEVLADRPDGTVVRVGAVVAKAHAPDTEPEELAARLSLAASPGLAGILLPPLRARDAPLPAQAGPSSARHEQPPAHEAPLHAEGRAVSLWPYGVPVDPSDPDAAPWEEAALLLARLHRTPPPHPLPPMRGPAKAARAVARMCDALPGNPAVAPVLAAWHGLPGWARAEEPGRAGRDGFLCHGDLHLGQLVRHPAPHGPWLLIDVDDTGPGDPAWDLARPAAWYAAGLLPPEVWLRFLDAYRAAGGPAVRAEGDPWPELDVPARALTVQTAALALARSAAEGRGPDEVEQLMIDACVRIASLPPELADGRAS
ncbi:MULTISPECIES: phosphotransferase family protein [unclassified Streptomyces]|uniref:phosphotransferase family protein n=1 Tax=unclassified Streptomyces TaxID=2593676 RepID=UPI0009392F70|nr:aminoglycoside phosphotransferase family protein [Streptomyces sp. CB02058]OKI91248.1 aminoglycoside phosphotransferase [Streptomyces sp. CB02058]